MSNFRILYHNYLHETGVGKFAAASNKSNLFKTRGSWFLAKSSDAKSNEQEFMLEHGIFTVGCKIFGGLNVPLPYVINSKRKKYKTYICLEGIPIVSKRIVIICYSLRRWQEFSMRSNHSGWFNNRKIICHRFLQFLGFLIRINVFDFILKIC